MVRPTSTPTHDRLSVLTLSVLFTLGVLIVLFFQCITALLSPAHRRGDPIKWGLVSYTALIFSLMTIQITTELYVQSLSYIDNREFPGDDVSPPGPYGYQTHIAPEGIVVMQNVPFVLNNWLADGLLVSSLFDAAVTHPGV